MKTLITYLTEAIGHQSIFVIVKPGFLNQTEEIIKRFKESGWEIQKTTVKKLLLQEAKELYSIHKKEDWYEGLCEYMSSDITRAFIFTKPGIQGEQTFKETGELKDKIREEFGESDMRNVIHSSDSIEHMEFEKGIYF